jgi:hypothetical protein
MFLTRRHHVFGQAVPDDASLDEMLLSMASSPVAANASSIYDRTRNKASQSRAARESQVISRRLGYSLVGVTS